MKTNIEVKSRAEGDAIKQGLEDPVTRATVQLVGLLAPLTPEQRAKVLGFVQDR